MTAAGTITTIPILPLGMVNAFLLKTDEGAVLIDTGMPGNETKVERALAANGLGWRDLKLIVVTHGHIDHAGSAKRIRDLSGAPILLHDEERSYCLGAPPLLKPTSVFGWLFRQTGVVQGPFDTFDPDISLSGSETFDLAGFGVPGTVLFTPGHTPGSISVLLDNGVAFAGDLAATGILLGGVALKGRPQRPPFEESPREVAASLEMLLDKGAHTFYVGHGGPLNPATVRRHLRHLARLD